MEEGAIDFFHADMVKTYKDGVIKTIAERRAGEASDLSADRLWHPQVIGLDTDGRILCKVVRQGRRTRKNRNYSPIESDRLIRNSELRLRIRRPAMHNCAACDEGSLSAFYAYTFVTSGSSQKSSSSTPSPSTVRLHHAKKPAI